MKFEDDFTPQPKPIRPNSARETYAIAEGKIGGLIQSSNAVEDKEEASCEEMEIPVDEAEGNSQVEEQEDQGQCVIQCVIFVVVDILSIHWNGHSNQHMFFTVLENK